MATKGRTKRTTRKTNESDAPTAQPATATPAKADTPALPTSELPSECIPPTVEQIIFGRLFAPGHTEWEMTAKFLESVSWRNRYKPTIEELLRAKDIAEWVVAAIIGGKQESWKRLTKAWHVLNDLETKAKLVGRAAAKVDRLLYRSAVMEDDAALERIAAVFRSELAYLDSTFTELKTDDVARIIKGVAKERPDNPKKYAKGGQGKVGAFNILAKLCVLCGAFGAEKMSPFANKSNAYIEAFADALRRIYGKSGRKPLEFQPLFVPGRRHQSPQ